MIRHVVLMQFADPAHALEAARRLQSLGPQIPDIASLEVGVDVVRSEVSWHFALITTHESRRALESYQAHPSHQEFGAWVRPLLAARAVVDIDDTDTQSVPAFR